MSVERIMAVTIPAAIALIFIGLFGVINSCQEKNQRFRMECVAKGGTVIGSGENIHCVMNANSKKD